LSDTSAASDGIKDESDSAKAQILQSYSTTLISLIPDPEIILLKISSRILLYIFFDFPGKAFKL
jgi:hypothetical protein